MKRDSYSGSVLANVTSDLRTGLNSTLAGSAFAFCEPLFDFALDFTGAFLQKNDEMYVNCFIEHAYMQITNIPEGCPCNVKGSEGASHAVRLACNHHGDNPTAALDGLQSARAFLDVRHNRFQHGAVDSARNRLRVSNFYTCVPDAALQDVTLAAFGANTGGSTPRSRPHSATTAASAASATPAASAASATSAASAPQAAQGATTHSATPAASIQ